MAREGGWKGGGGGWAGGGSWAGANGVVVGLAGQKINALMNKKGLSPPIKHTPPVTRIWSFWPKIGSITRGGGVYGRKQKYKIVREEKTCMSGV